jgi:hypothetical protein
MSGKSSAMQAIETSLLAKGFVKDPIKKGEKQATIEYSGVDLEGNPIKIITNIEEGNVYSFTAAIVKDNKMKTISDPKKIRELMGTYYPLTVNDVLGYVKYAEGRREFITKYLLPLLSEEQQKRLAELKLNTNENKTKATENNWYHTRTTLNKELEALNATIKAQVLSDEEKATVATKTQVLEALKKLEDELLPHQNDAITRININSVVKTITAHRDKMIAIFNEAELEYSAVFEDKEKIIAVFDKLIEDEIGKLNTLWTAEQIQTQKDKIERGKAKKTTIETLEGKTNPDPLKVAERDKKFLEITELDQKIQKAKEEIKLIYSNSKLPAGLEIDEETIMLNGFVLDETTNSETEARMAIVELLCNLSTNEYVCIGDWSLYDSTMKKEILALAKKDNKIFLGQLVTEDTEVKLQTLIID